MPVGYRSHTLRPASAPGDVNGSSLACPTPPGATTGDVLLAFVSRSQTSRTATAVTAPGWTLAAFYPGATGPDRMLAAVLWRPATGAEPASHTFTTPGASALDQFSIHCYALTGADTTNPIMAGPAYTDAPSGSGSNCIAPTLTLPSPGLLLCWYGLPHWSSTGTATSFTPPPGMTERIDGDPGQWLQCASYTESRAAGATGTRTAVYSASPAGPPRGVSVAIREGVTADPPTVGAGADITVVAGTTITRTATESNGGATITAREWRVV